jgi:hypothetical protein
MPKQPLVQVIRERMAEFTRAKLADGKHFEVMWQISNTQK